jgi:hypothetical protein
MRQVLPYGCAGASRLIMNFKLTWDRKDAAPATTVCCAAPFDGSQGDDGAFHVFMQGFLEGFYLSARPFDPLTSGKPHWAKNKDIYLDLAGVVIRR